MTVPQVLTFGLDTTPWCLPQFRGSRYLIAALPVVCLRAQKNDKTILPSLVGWVLLDLAV